MWLYQILVYLYLLVTISAVDMSNYSVGPNVEVEFEAFLKELYATAEDKTACFNFLDFFHPPEQLIVVDSVALGALAVLALKEKLLPPMGSKHWNHLPNKTFVHSQSKTRKTYEVHGVIESTFEAGNCSIAYYKTLFPVMKDRYGVPQLQPHGGQLIAYDDFLVRPFYSPTEIPCSD